MPIYAMTRRLRRVRCSRRHTARVHAISHGAKGATPWRTVRDTGRWFVEEVGYTRARQAWIQAEGDTPPHAGGARGEGQGGEGGWRRAPGMANGSRPPIGADPVELLEEQAASRVPELVPIRYGRMLVSPFTFFRGAAYPMAADLAGAPRTGLHVQLCGDAHLSNFGGFAAPDRRLVFSINDFDETLPGPFEWDVKRLVASFAVAGRDRGFDAKQRQVDQPGGDAVVPRGDQELRRDVEPRPLVLAHRRRRDRRAGGRARRPQSSGSGSSATWRRRGRRTACRAFAKLTEVVDGEPRIVERPAADRPDRGGRVRRRRGRARGVRTRASSAPTGAR